ncbi:MAG: hypothetical protein EBU49_14410 [Proteobacteria bacterium]|nr:hypothetical protein [Pseudomonadota bacterium]
MGQRFFYAAHSQFFFSALVTIASADQFQCCGLASMNFRSTAKIRPTFAFDGEQIENRFLRAPRAVYEVSRTIAHANARCDRCSSMLFDLDQSWQSGALLTSERY